MQVVNRSQNCQVEDVSYDGEGNTATRKGLEARSTVGKVGRLKACVGAQLTAKDKNSTPDQGGEVLRINGQ